MLNTDTQYESRPGIHSPLTAIARWICYAGVALILLLPLPVLYEVVADQLEQPPIWVFETTGYVIILIAFLASGYGLSTGHHFKVELLAQRFPAMATQLAVLSGILEAVFGLILLSAGAMQAYAAFEQDMRSDTLLAVPLFWPMLAFPMGGFAILVQGIGNILKAVRGGRSS
ncbi:TRAP transporter small permease [[Pseudomonas] carboxydohydrogena]|uniref:TRAP transporter small permease protein n=1 Tax=Afipia carboxydohydrogena TaxID=290 RepID=A0ABY8BNX3_AFICR|nr:TRAP transporter small permease [[Pseudomonas] carboxydohydrogena]WEF50691.1 TRAP transporter small permease [[Pseudomonas] carboxydohydrogena]